MKGYFKRLKDHPGLGTAIFLPIIGFLAGAGNKSAEWYVGGIFGFIVFAIVAWSCVLISNIKRKK